MQKHPITRPTSGTTSFGRRRFFFSATSALGAAWLASGKHVYVEKPVSHNIREGRLLAEAAAKRPNLIVQHGMQRRSDTGWHEIMDWVNAGNLGKVKTSLGLNFKARKSIGKTGGSVQPPASVDYNLWCGPREMKLPHRKQFHYDWHWQWDYGNGDIGNQGPHQLDVARWALGQMKLPAAVLSVGGRFGYVDDGETANTQFALFDYKPAPLLFDNRGLPRKDMDWAAGEPRMPGLGIANIIECEGGIIAESRALELNEAFLEHLAANGIDPAKSPIRCGALLTFDPDKEIFTGEFASEANALATESYREEFKLPEIT